MEKSSLTITSMFLYIIFSLVMSCGADEVIDPDMNQTSQPDISLEGEAEFDPDSILLNFTSRYGVAMYQYAQVNKRGDYFRRMFIDSSSVATFLQNGEIPEGTTIAMETWFGESSQSSIFFRTKRNDVWLSGSFSPSSPNLGSAISINSCNNCHNIAESRDFTFTRPLIARSFLENEIQFVECDRGPTGPCDLNTYLGE